MAPTFFVLLLAAFALAGAARHFPTVLRSPADEEDSQLYLVYESWMAEHGRVYNGMGEKARRFEAFKDNYKYIEEHNRQPNTSYWLGLNNFADMSNHEFRAVYFGNTTNPLRDRRNKVAATPFRYQHLDPNALPRTVDWRSHGAVADVKNQGSCGSCWAFSTVAAVEGVNKIASGTFISLSEQELVDCDKQQNQGCDGGLMDYAFQFILQNGGLDSEEDYPYKGESGTCDESRRNSHVVAIDGFEDVPPGSETDLFKAVANQPVSVAIEAGGRSFQLYSGGVYSGECGTSLDHGVVAIGYGSEGGVDYWIVRNSWGPAWGEGGYIRLQRNVASRAGKCGIAIEPSYPVKNKVAVSTNSAWDSS